MKKFNAETIVLISVGGLMAMMVFMFGLMTELRIHYSENTVQLEYNSSEYNNALNVIKNQKVNDHSLKDLYDNMFTNVKWDSYKINKEDEIIVEFDGDYCSNTNVKEHITIQWFIGSHDKPMFLYMQTDNNIRNEKYYDYFNNTISQNYVSKSVIDQIIGLSD